MNWVMIICAVAFFIFAYRDWQSEEASSIILLEFTWFTITKAKQPTLFNFIVLVEIALGLLALYIGVAGA